MNTMQTSMIALLTLTIGLATSNATASPKHTPAVESKNWTVKRHHCHNIKVADYRRGLLFYRHEKVCHFISIPTPKPKQSEKNPDK